MQSRVPMCCPASFTHTLNRSAHMGLNHESPRLIQAVQCVDTTIICPTPFDDFDGWKKGSLQGLGQADGRSTNTEHASAFWCCCDWRPSLAHIDLMHGHRMKNTWRMQSPFESTQRSAGLRQLHTPRLFFLCLPRRALCVGAVLGIPVGHSFIDLDALAALDGCG